MDLSIVDKNNESRKRVFKTWYSHKNKKIKMMLKIKTPAKLLGTGFLSIIDNIKDKKSQWMYLPKYKKVKRLKQSNSNDSFLGSELSLSDMGIAVNTDVKLSLLEEEEIDSKKCFVIKMIPKLDIFDAVTLRSLIYIRKDNFSMIRTKVFNPKGELEKLLVVESFTKFKDNYYLLKKIVVKNVINKRSAILKVVKRITMPKIKNNFFSIRQLEKRDFRKN